MAKILTGKIVSTKMNRTVVVMVEHRIPHPMYKKLLKRSRRFKADTNGQSLSLGQTVRISETRPQSGDKHFKVLDIKEQKG
jgi:small subunit ribosomal protein S17